MTLPDWRHMPSLSALRAFHATAEAGSFVGAANALSVTQAAVAQQVRALEADLGLALVQRAGRGIALTAEAERLAASLDEGFARLSAGVAAARVRNEDRGLRVAATQGLASRVLLPKLSAFWEEHPEIEVTIVPDRRSVDLLAEGFDLAIRARDVDDVIPGAQVDILIESAIVAVAAPELIAERSVDALPWLTQDPWERGLLSKAGLDVEHMVFRHVGPPSMEAQAARMGYGVMICPEVMIREDLTHGKLAVLPITGFGTMAYQLMTPPGPDRAPVRAYIDWLRRVLEGEGLSGDLT